MPALAGRVGAESRRGTMPRCRRSSTLIGVAALAAMSLGIATSLGVPRAQAQAAGSDEEGRRAVFRVLDIDGDGRISRSEFELKKVFVIYGNAKGRTPTLRIEDTRLSRRAFDELDIEKNGILEISDVVSAPPFQFTHWDRNGDGEIDWAEFGAVVDELQR
jgi:hypothetical protein